MQIGTVRNIMNLFPCLKAISRVVEAPNGTDWQFVTIFSLQPVRLLTNTLVMRRITAYTRASFFWTSFKLVLWINQLALEGSLFSKFTSKSLVGNLHVRLIYRWTSRKRSRSKRKTSVDQIDGTGREWWWRHKSCFDCFLCISLMSHVKPTKAWKSDGIRIAHR